MGKDSTLFWLHCIIGLNVMLIVLSFFIWNTSKHFTEQDVQNTVASTVVSIMDSLLIQDYEYTEGEPRLITVRGWTVKLEEQLTASVPAGPDSLSLKEFIEQLDKAVIYAERVYIQLNETVHGGVRVRNYQR